MLKKICGVCNKQYETYNKNRLYCTRECYNKIKWITDQKGNKNKMWKDIISKDELVELYVNQKQSIHFISHLKNCSESLIRTRLYLYSIRKRGYKEQFDITLKENRIRRSKRDINSVKGNRKTYLEIAKQHKEWKCEYCGKLNTNNNFDLIVHHKDKNNKNNNVWNIQILCQSCHTKEHRKQQFRNIICVECKKEFYGYEQRKFCSKRCLYKYHDRRKRDKQCKQ